MSVTLQSRYDNYVTIYNAFLNSLRETFPEVIIQKNTTKYKIVSVDTNVPDYYFNVVYYEPNESATIRIDLPETDFYGNNIINGKLMIISNFTQNGVLEVYYKNNIVANVLTYNKFINPFYAFAFSGGQWKNLSAKDEFVFELNSDGEPIITADIDVNVKAEINLAQLAAISQLSSNQITTKKYIKFSDLTYDPEVYELDNNEGFLYVKDGALVFKDASNRIQNISFPSFLDPHLLTPQSQFKLENDLDSIEGKVIKDLLNYKNISVKETISEFTNGQSGQSARFGANNFIYLYEGVSLNSVHSWGFWSKPLIDINTLPDDEKTCLFSYGDNNNNYRLYIDTDKKLNFAIKVNGSHITVNTIDYLYDSTKWHHIIVSFDSSNNKIEIYINGILYHTFTNEIISNLVGVNSHIDYSYIGNQGEFFLDEIKHFIQEINPTKVQLEYDSYFRE